MKCDLCKREAVTQQILCDTCAEAIQRLVTINKRAEQTEAPRAFAKTNAA